MNKARLAEGTYEEESQVEISQRCPREKKLKGIVNELKLEDNFPEEVLA